jgi:hypothetical protein
MPKLFGELETGLTCVIRNGCEEAEEEEGGGGQVEYIVCF